MAKTITTCPHCESNLIPHIGDNEAYTHCNTCGCCFVAEDGSQRPGHPVCNPEAARAMAQFSASASVTEAVAHEVESLTRGLEDKDKTIEEKEKELTNLKKSNEDALSEKDKEIAELTKKLEEANKQSVPNVPAKPTEGNK